jgi:hypothetical protein
MSSETRFATSHSDFWQALLPMGDTYIRSHNLDQIGFTRPLHSTLAANRRGVVNEAGFLIFHESIKLSRRPLSLPSTRIDELLEDAAEYVSKLRQGGAVSLQELSGTGTSDALQIAEKLHQYFSNEHSDILVKPSFLGCGWINGASGDVLCGTTLYEVKAGERHFRISDIRQLLCYCALDFSAKGYGIREVALINPRAGTLIKEDLEVLCQKLSGSSSADVLGEIVDYVSEPSSRYQGI